jgi:hypothetical protein
MRYYSSSLLVDWEAEADPAYGDYAVLPIIAAFFPALRFLIDRFLFEVNLFVCLLTLVCDGLGYQDQLLAYVHRLGLSFLFNESPSSSIWL